MASKVRITPTLVQLLNTFGRELHRYDSKRSYDWNEQVERTLAAPSARKVRVLRAVLRTIYMEMRDREPQYDDGLPTYLLASQWGADAALSVALGE